MTREELEAAAGAVGSFRTDNRAGIAGTLHRISAIRSRRGAVVGLTCRVGRAVSGHVEMVRDILAANTPVLFLGRPGVGKTTVIRWGPLSGGGGWGFWGGGGLLGGGLGLMQLGERPKRKRPLGAWRRAARGGGCQQPAPDRCTLEARPPPAA